MKDIDYYRIHEIAKQSFFVHEIREYLRSINIETPVPIIDSAFVQKILESKDLCTERILLPHQLIPSLHNFKSRQDISQILNCDLNQMIDWIKKFDDTISRHRTYDLLEMVEHVKNQEITPPLLLLTYGNINLIDGRTRLLIAYALKKDIYCDIVKNIL
jgi:hypothetical protein